ncbi:MAG: lytic transglycosylase domain-containing protein [Gemmatimonadales bacterium]
MRKPTSKYEMPERPTLRQLALRGTLLAAVVAALGMAAGLTRGVRAADETEASGLEFASREVADLQVQLSAARGDLAVAKLATERAETILKYSTQYQIPADLATSIHDVALSEGIDPSIGFRLVQVESNFKSKARSSASAIGYTQVRLPTARFYQAGITERQLYDRDTNLRIGFRFLKDLLGHFDGDLRLALLAYNRGPQRVRDILAAGGDPSNGYEGWVMGLKRKAPVRPAAVEVPAPQVPVVLDSVPVGT